MQRLERRAPAPWGKTCAFTGHRPNKYPYFSDEKSAPYRALVSHLRTEVQALIQDGYTHFLSGGALGVDTLAALLILDMKKENPDLTLEMAVPCPQQADRWPEPDRRTHAFLCESADVLTVISDAANNRKLLEELKNVPAPRTARFVSAVCLLRPGREPLICEGACEGEITFELRGEGGFGYDPLFASYDLDGATFGEAPDADKQRISHRARAIAALKELLEAGR